VGGLLALADDPPDPETVRLDPALVLHCIRYARPPLTTWTSTTLSDPAILTTAAAHLEHFAVGRSDWQSNIDPRILAVSRAGATAAAGLYSANPAAASVAALLAPLGWFAAAAINPDAAAPDKAFAWGLSAESIARRLARSWNLPPWLAAIMGNLSHPVELAESLGADPALFRAVQAAVAAAERGILDLHLVPTADRDLFEQAAAILQDSKIPGPPPTPLGLAWHADPRTVPLVIPLLKAKAEARRKTGATTLNRAEAENDALRDLLAEANDQFVRAVQDAKLTAVAELAAGAGHEINNPLAVISGHCQRLLGHEEDEETRATLETVVRQTKRIHEILRGLMQFARPTKPNPQSVRTADLVGYALADVRSLAAVKAVEIREDVSHPGHVFGDLHQLRTCLVNVLRNAIEAAGPDGWVRVSGELAAGRVRLIVEDSGPGPSPNQAAHLFDPFYSGKAAGRGRGLGLSVAWRLANVNTATLRHEPTPKSRARFVLSLPQPVSAVTPVRIPA
jgi:signal transduction histidine kinase